MSTTYHADFWHPRTGMDPVLSKMLEVLPSLGFGLREGGAPGRPEEFRKILATDSTKSVPTLSLGPLLHLPTNAEVFFSLEEFRTKEGVAIRVHLSAQEPQFRRNFAFLTPINSAKIQFEAALIGFYERTNASYGHGGTGGQGVWTYIKGLDYNAALTIEASKVLRDEIPLMDHLNLVPKAMYSKFLGSDDRLDRHEARLRVAELHDEGLLIALSDCLDMGGTTTSWWQFAEDFGLRLDVP